MAGYGSVAMQYPWAREWVTPEEEDGFSPIPNPNGIMAPTLFEGTGTAPLLQAKQDAMREGDTARIREEVFNKANQDEQMTALRATLGRLLTRGEQADPLGTLKSAIPMFSTMMKPPVKQETKPQVDLSNPQGLASFLAAKSGTGADNLNYTAVLQRELAAGKPLPEAIDAANKARAGVTGEVAFSRGQGYGTGANTGPAAQAKTDLTRNQAFNRAQGEAEGLLAPVGNQPGQALAPGGKSAAEATGEAKLMGQGLPAETQDVITGFDNVMGAIQRLEQEFPPTKAAQYVGFLNKPARQLAQIAQNDPEFARFANLTNQLRLMAFDLGGKQLTATEKAVVESILPLGNEYSMADFEANIKGVKERLGRLRQGRLGAASMTRGEAGRELQGARPTPRGEYRKNKRTGEVKWFPFEGAQ